jgi:hypothetical protein
METNINPARHNIRNFERIESDGSEHSLQSRAAKFESLSSQACTKQNLNPQSLVRAIESDSQNGRLRKLSAENTEFELALPKAEVSRIKPVLSATYPLWCRGCSLEFPMRGRRRRQ